MKKVIIFLILANLLILSAIAVYSQQNNSSLEYPTSNYTNKYAENDINISSIKPIEIVGFIPQTFKIGDVQFNIRVQNNNDFIINNVIAIVSGRGFSTYDIVPIETLAKEERDYIIVSGNFKESSNITLTIRIENQIFYQNVNVIGENQAELDEKLKQEQERINILNNLSNQLLDLKQKYSELETDYYNKKDNYDLSKVSLTDFKKYINDIELDIINENIKDAKAKIQLANEAYLEQKKKLSEAQTISTVTKLKNNALIFSTIAGSLITFFALYELLKRKSENVVQGVKIVHKKIKKPNKKSGEKIRKKKY